MRSPKDMQIILIDITNACTERCSNCTRFCGNHKKNFFMDVDTFKRAVDSMDGFEGLVALIGGEPTLHPKFEEFAHYLQSVYGKNPKADRLAYPQKDFIKELLHEEFDNHKLHIYEDGHKTFERTGPGIYSNMSPTYRKYQELCADTFHVQFLNDHINPSYHQPGLVSRKDLGIPDDEWIKLRDACWLQGAWSATITPKGAFFCEVAAALDMLFDGPGGWPIEPGWWKREPSEFGDQLKWCELCGFALSTFMRESSDEVDDVSPTLYEKLKQVDSPRLKAGRTHLLEIKDGKIAETSKASGKRFSATQKYVEHYEDRFNANSSLLFEHDFEVVETKNKAENETFGEFLNRSINASKGWILLFKDKESAENTEKIRNLMKECILNPGTLHIGDGYYFFHKNALSLKHYGFDRVARFKEYSELKDIWEESKVVKIGDSLQAWKRESIISGKRYVIWGMGVAGSFLSDAVNCSGGEVVFVVDRDPVKQGTDFYGAKAYAPEYLKEQMDEFDYLLIGHYSRFDEMKDEALKIGVPEEKIIMPYEV
ncbi:MAG: hypothetical protein E7232_10470 [Lachnospiraceae bacterium]|jgi:hypothetical protein|nr:hypothetical protein [Lachnospiraceae bacterium]